MTRMTLPCSTYSRGDHGRNQRCAGPAAPGRPRPDLLLGHTPLVGEQQQLECADEARAPIARHPHRAATPRRAIDAGPGAGDSPAWSSRRLISEKDVSSSSASALPRPGNGIWTTECERQMSASTTGRNGGPPQRIRTGPGAVLPGEHQDARAELVDSRGTPPRTRTDSMAGNQVRPRLTTTGARPATARQRQFIRALAREIGLADADLERHARHRFGAGTAELSQDEAAKFIHRLGRAVAEMHQAAVA